MPSIQDKITRLRAELMVAEHKAQQEAAQQKMDEHAKRERDRRDLTEFAHTQAAMLGTMYAALLNQGLTSGDAQQLADRWLRAQMSNARTPQDDAVPVEVPEAQRNSAVFKVASILVDRFPTEWQTKLAVYNNTFVSPPLTVGELATIVRYYERHQRA